MLYHVHRAYWARRSSGSSHYVTVTIPGTNKILTLCEVEVHAMKWTKPDTDTDTDTDNNGNNGDNGDYSDYGNNGNNGNNSIDTECSDCTCDD